MMWQQYLVMRIMLVCDLKRKEGRNYKQMYQRYSSFYFQIAREDCLLEREIFRAIDIHVELKHKYKNERWH